MATASQPKRCPAKIPAKLDPRLPATPLKALLPVDSGKALESDADVLDAPRVVPAVVDGCWLLRKVRNSEFGLKT